MDALKIVYTSAASVLVLFILTKIIGNKQMSQLNMFDYITGISIGSIAAEMATALDGEMIHPLIAMAVYAVISVVIAFASSKSLTMRRFLSGTCVLLFENGTLYKKNLKSVRLNVSDILTECRINGYFSLSDVDSIYMEESGKLSILPKSSARPLTPSDMSMNPASEKPDVCVIMDGKVLEGNLRFRGKNAVWLDNRLHDQGYRSASEILLATVDTDNNLSVYKTNDKKENRDMFQ